MPEFSTAFSGLSEKKLLTHEELVRSIRFMIAAEYEAIQLYTQLAESTDNKLAKEVLIDIANEEKVHAGEFLRLLKELAPDEEEFYKAGAQEVEEEIEKLGKWKTFLIVPVCIKQVPHENQRYFLFIFAKSHCSRFTIENEQYQTPSHRTVHILIIS